MIRWLIVFAVLAPVVLFVVGACMASARNDEVAFVHHSEDEERQAEMAEYLDAWERATGADPQVLQQTDPAATP